MNKPPDLSIMLGGIFQINPDAENFKEKDLGGLFIVATEVKDWGIQGYILSPYDMGDSLVRFKGKAFLRPKWEDIEYCGTIHWEMVENE